MRILTPKLVAAAGLQAIASNTLAALHDETTGTTGFAYKRLTPITREPVFCLIGCALTEEEREQIGDRTNYVDVTCLIDQKIIDGDGYALIGMQRKHDNVQRDYKSPLFIKKRELITYLNKFIN